MKSGIYIVMIATSALLLSGCASRAPISSIVPSTSTGTSPQQESTGVGSLTGQSTLPTGAAASGETKKVVVPKSDPRVIVHTNKTVVIKNFAFVPTDIAIPAGSTITRVNNDAASHTITSDDGFFDETVAPGRSFTHTFVKAGTYTYHCNFHPSMTAKISVQ